MFLPECTSKCKSREHAALILTAITKGTVPEIQTYCRYLCHNFWTVSDASRRTALHLAASVGKVELVEWLLNQCHAEVDVRDRESGWTPLHRAIFYGQLHCVRSLLRYGASLSTTDREGFTPLDLAVKDRLPYIEYALSNACDVYVWGSNENFTLGLACEQSPKHPELIETFRRDGIGIMKVEMQKFHSLFLASSGTVYSCGHGLGGRLGLNSEETRLTVTQISAVKNSRCSDIASGQDHTVLLTDDGHVLTCGMNTYHQLGHLPPPTQLLSPKPISLKFLKDKKVVGICAARYHTVVYTKDAVYTFGLNAGQLGHPKGDRLQSVPRQVSPLNSADVEFTHVVSADGAIVCGTKKGDIFVLHEYQCRKIASKQLEIKKLSVVGGQLDHRCDVASLREGGGQELKVALLTRSGKIYVWQSSNPVMTRCLFCTIQQVTVTDICLNQQNLGIITKDGEGFIGYHTARKEPRRKSHDIPPGKTTASPALTSSLVTFLDRDECEHIKLKRIRHVNRAAAISCSGSGHSFAVLQSHPKVGLLEFPAVDPSTFQADFLQLLEGAQEVDCMHDIVLKVKNSCYPAHRYILMSRSDFFQKHASKVDDKDILVCDQASAKVFEEVLCFIYTNSCTLLEYGGCAQVVGSSNRYGCLKKATAAFVKEVQEAAKKLGVHTLAKRLDKAQVSENRICLTHTSSLQKLRFDRNRFPHLQDVTLISGDGIQFSCHRCVLAARLEYFASMLSLGWAETSQQSLSLSIPSKVLGALLDFLYTDDCPVLKASEDIEFLCHVLVAADQLLVTRLKQMCEAALSELVTLKNVAELLEISCIYNAAQLKTVCMHFMCINIPAMLESSSLEALSDDVLQDLTACYREIIPAMSRRLITPYMDSPSKDRIEKIFEEYGHQCDHNIFSSSKSNDTKTRTRRKYQVRRESESSPVINGTSPPLPTVTGDVSDKPHPDWQGVHEPSVVPSTACVVPRIRTVQTVSAKLAPVTSTPVPLKLQLNGSSPLPILEKLTAPLSTLPLSPPFEGTFPSLKEAAQGTEKSLKSFGRTDVKRSAKVSQKQRKQTGTSKAPDGVFHPCSPPSNTCPWSQNTPPQSPPTSFWDSKSPASALSAEMLPDSSNCVFPNLSVGSPPSTVPNMTDILKDEEAKVHNLKKMKAKPLDVIHIEDKAIEELLHLYHVEDNPEERISVTRVLPEVFAAPVWKKKF